MRGLLIGLVIIESVVLVYLLLDSGSTPAEPSTSDRTELPSAADDRQAAATLRGSDQPDSPQDTPAPAETTAEPIEAVLVSGRVLGPDGEPLGTRFACGLIEPAGNVLQAFARHETGHFARADVKPGIYHFRALARGFATHDQLIEVPDTSPTFEFTVELERLTQIPVFLLTESGEPLRESSEALEALIRTNISVLADRQAPPEQTHTMLEASLRSYAQASYVPVGMDRNRKNHDGRDGTLHVRGDFPIVAALYLRQLPLRSVELVEAPPKLEFRIAAKELTDKLSGVSFRLSGVNDPSDLKYVVVMLHTTTDGEADEVEAEREGDRFTVSGFPPGDHHLQIHAGEAYAPYIRNVRLPAGTLLDLGTIPLRNLVQAKVRIEDSRGQPVAGAYVWPYDLDAGWEQQQGIPMRFSSDAKGLVRMAVGPHRYSIFIREPEGGWHAAEIDLRDGAGDPVVVELPEFQALTMRTGSSGLPISVRIQDREGRIVTARRFRKHEVWPLGLAVGDYTMTITDRNGQRFTRPLEVTPETGMVVIEAPSPR